MWEQRARVEELDSDDTDTQGVGLSSGKRFFSDPLQFTGVDLAAGSRARRGYGYDDTEGSTEGSDDSEEDETTALQVALRDKEEALVQSALARIRRAQEKGRREVKLNQEELDALETRRKRMQSAATSKSRKEGGSDRSSGSEKRRRSEKQLVTIPVAAPERPSSSTKKRSKSRRSEETQTHPPAASNPPGMLVAGPDGLTYAPIGYYPPQSSASNSRRSPSRPRSASSHQMLGSTPPQFNPHHVPASSRHYSDGNRPPSSSSNSSRRPLPDEEGWMPGYSRRSSISSHVDPFEYQISSGHPPPIPHQYQTGRRIVSGPEIAYSSVRRNPAGYPAALMPASDPVLRRKSSGRGDTESSEDDDDESDELGNGVQVFVEEEKEKEKESEKAPVSRKPVGSGRKKRGKK